MDPSPSSSFVDCDPTLAGDETDEQSQRSPELQRGDTVGRYLVLAQVGRGGMGAVYAAHDPQLDRKIALKVVESAAFGAASDEAARERALAEAQTLARLSHPNVVTVHDAGEFRGGLFIAMEYVEGRTAARWRREEAPGWRRIVEVFVAAGRGLAAAHEAGIVHRDFKPGNVMIDDQGTVRVLDFGLARPVGEALDGSERHLGTPAYMAPEAHEDPRADARVDQFSFCVALYELLYGQRPFAGDAPQEIVASILEDRLLPPPRGTGVPRWVAPIVMRGLQRDPARRWPSMDALVEALEGGDRRRRRMLAGFGALAVAAGVLGGSWLTKTPECRVPTVDDAWGEERRADVAAAFAALDASWAQDTLQRVLADMDERADDLARGLVRACEARRDETGTPRALAAVDACLDRTRVRLSAMADVLAAADATVVERVPEMLDAEGAEVCFDPDLRTTSSDDPRARELDARLERFHVAVTAGRVQQALDEDPDLLADADALGDDGLAARARGAVGMAWAHLGRADDALRLLRESIGLAARCRCDRVAAMRWLDLVNVLAIDAGRPRDAVMLHVAAEASVARLGDPAQLKGELESARGVALLYLGDYDEAEIAFDRALGLLVSRMATLGTLSNLAGIQLLRGEYRAAVESYGRVVKIEEDELGASHPRTVDDRGNLALARLFVGKFAQAEAGLRSAIAGLKAAQGVDSYRVARAWSKLAYAQLVQGKVEEAAATVSRGVQSLRGSVGEQFEYAVAVGLRATIESVRNEDEAANRDFEEALALVGELAGSDGPTYANLVIDRARSVASRGRGREIEGELEQAISVFRKVSSRHPLLTPALVDLGEIRLRAGDRDRAVEDLEEAVEIAKSTEVWPPERARAELLLAVALTAAGRDSARAEELATGAAETFARWPDYPWSEGEEAAAFLADPEATVARWTGSADVRDRDGG